MDSNLRESLRGMFGDAYMKVFDAIDRSVLSPEERLRAREADPEFRRADDIWQEYVRAAQARKAAPPGMLPLHQIINGNPPPKRGVQPFVPPPAGGIRG